MTTFEPGQLTYLLRTCHPGMTQARIELEHFRAREGILSEAIGPAVKRAGKDWDNEALATVLDHAVVVRADAEGDLVSSLRTYQPLSADTSLLSLEDSAEPAQLIKAFPSMADGCTATPMDPDPASIIVERVWSQWEQDAAEQRGRLDFDSEAQARQRFDSMRRQASTYRWPARSAEVRTTRQHQTEFLLVHSWTFGDTELVVQLQQQGEAWRIEVARQELPR